MAFATHETTFVNTPIEKLFTDLIMGADALDKGIAQMLPGFRKEVSLNRFYVTGDSITTPPVDGKFTPSANTMNKDEKALIMQPLYWAQEFNAKDFNIDHKFLWTTGATGMVQPSNVLLSAIKEKVVDNFNVELGYKLWTGFGSMVGWDSLLVADATVIPVAPVVITAANVQEEFEKYIQAAAANNIAILYKGSAPQFVVHPLILAYYQEAARLLPNKGSDITEAVMSRYGGYNIITDNGMPLDKIFFGKVGGGDESELKVAAWADSDRFNVEIARTGPLDSTFGVAIEAEIGVEYIYGKQIVYTKA